MSVDLTLLTAREKLRRQIATDIHWAVQHKPMALVADGGQLVTVLAELILRRVEDAGYQPPPPMDLALFDLPEVRS